MPGIIELIAYTAGITAALAGAVILVPAIAWKKEGAPFIPSRHKEIKQILNLAQIMPNETTLDLGSGDGRIVIAMARIGSYAHGYEINPTLIFWSRLKIFILGLSNKAHIHNTNFWDKDLSKYDVITLFGITRIMDKLEIKLQYELKPGARVVSNIFQFPNWKPVKKVGHIYLYIK